jgi:hypothetical protein
MCSMKNNGTRNAGISSSGRVAIGPVLISPVAPVVNRVFKAPILTATTRSNIPKRFQRMNALLVANPGLRASAIMIHGAVKPMPMSPRPAGRANTAGSTFCAYNARNPSPANRHACIPAMRRRSSESANTRIRGKILRAASTQRTAAGAQRLLSQRLAEVSREGQRMRRWRQVTRRAGTMRSTLSRRLNVYHVYRDTPGTQTRQAGQELLLS